ncbi:MAG: hypothetical protein IAF02_22740 [Anaerolineae bacterium]|nr:hypothetical protein [Anaerolineae bacterium]
MYIMGYAVWFFSDHFPRWFLVLAPIILLASCIWGLLTLWQRLHTNLEFSKSELNGHTGWNPFSYFWTEIVFITEFEDTENKGKTTYLVIATQDRAREFNLTGFDKTAVWQAIETYAPPEILEPDAYQKLDSFKFYEQEIDKKLSSISLPVSVTLPIGMRMVFIVGFLFFSFCAYMSYASEPTASYIFIFFVLFNLYGILAASGSFIADTEKLIVKRLWGAYQINWSEIKYIEMSSQSGRIVFHGDGKQLSFAAPGLWGGKRKNDFYLFVAEQIEDKQLEFKTNWKAAWRFSKNVRVSRNG